jgi:hypothetical protein
MDSSSVHLEADFTLLRGELAGICRRKAKRYRFSLATVGFLTFDDGSSQEVWLVDISEKGIGFYSDWPLEPGTKLVLKLSGSAKGPIKLAAKIIHSTKHEKGNWLIGCEFAEMLEPQTLAELI